MSVSLLGKLYNILNIKMNAFDVLLDACEDLETDYDHSLETYEKRISLTLDMLSRASYITTCCFRIITIIKKQLKDHRVGSKEYITQKNAHDQIQGMMEIYRSHIYTYSSKSKTLVSMLHIKQAASTEVYRGGL
jgi:DNA polymerase III alpha subunit (gram-positive type)